eukprot:TRINITY_DN46913_c0_g1_i2.p1 TRINITY_DN46913_c0_g1~~TRINITY_DN46913_c0_g1_i2.p1  ORF type:complete len:1010 (-),score=225.61 TRINITY_DN46913_c0_g1_i2:61-3027(-)
MVAPQTDERACLPTAADESSPPVPAQAAGDRPQLSPQPLSCDVASPPQRVSQTRHRRVASDARRFSEEATGRLRKTISDSLDSVEQLVRQPRIIVEELRRTQHKPIGSAEVYASERAASARRFARLADSCRSEPRPLSVALSGGGVRAAAFSLGVLWRLAERGRLRDVEHLSAVSGGAYVATALPTFILAAIGESSGALAAIGETSGAPPASPTHGGLASSATPSMLAMQDLDMWYLRVIWQLIDRMQQNAGFLVRFGRNPFKRKGARPAAPGIMWLLSILLFAFVVLPAMNFLYIAVPLALLLDEDAGGFMRDGWCRSMDGLLLWTRTRGLLVLGLLASAVLLQMIISVLKKALVRMEPGRSGWRTFWFKIVFATRSAVLCFAVFVAVVIFLAWSALGIQWVDYDGKYACHQQELDQWPRRFSVWPLWFSLNLLVVALGVLGSCLRWPFLFLRQNHIAAVLSPMWAAFAGSLLARWRVFGPMMHRESFEETWRVVMVVLLCLAVLVLPTYGKLRQIVHLYYRRSLRKAFYHDGLDADLSALHNLSLCPNLIVAATLVDYCRAEEQEVPHYSEFFFTGQWMGGERTGYISTPDGFSLSTAMAISGAATDAFLLTKMNAMWVRITLLALFNLFMGDYIEFKSSIRQGRWCGRLQALAVNIIFVVFYVLLFVSTEAEMTPRASIVLFWSAWALLWLLLIVSFFGTLRWTRWVLSSVIIRHLHMAMMHYHTSEEPPLRLFLNDGGLVECLGLISLLRRRCEFMLVTDATADFSMQLLCLRDTMRLAESEHICTFFDPEDPRRGVEPLLQEWSRNPGKCLRIGVLYDCWGGPGVSAEAPHERRTGEIFFVRMRLHESGQQVGSKRITEREVLNPSATETGIEEAREATSNGSEDPEILRLLREELGGCCCDCCHKRCNCGLMGRFPDVATGNQFFTPTQFALFCRLGYEISAEAVDALTASQQRSRGRSNCTLTREHSALSSASAALFSGRL